MWLSDGADADGRRGKFIFYPSKSKPLKLERDDADFPVIEPHAMYTDGGSIPPAAMAFKGMSPWSYGPAYMMHDYLFRARACHGAGTPEAAPLPGIENMSFAETGDILAETIKALKRDGRVVDDDLAPSLISSATNGSISRQLWKGGSKCNPVSDDDMIRILAALTGSRAKLRRLNDQREAGDLEPYPDAVVVGQFAFDQ